MRRRAAARRYSAMAPLGLSGASTSARAARAFAVGIKAVVYVSEVPSLMSFSLSQHPSSGIGG